MCKRNNYSLAYPLVDHKERSTFSSTAAKPLRQGGVTPDGRMLYTAVLGQPTSMTKLQPHLGMRLRCEAQATRLADAALSGLRQQLHMPGPGLQ